MNDVNVYRQYFAAACEYNGVKRRGAAVSLIAASGGGQIRYTVQVSFFPFADPEDFCITYDAAAEKVLYEAGGRRSKKREQAFMKTLRTEADALAAGMGGSIFWEQPLRDAVFG